MDKQDWIEFEIDFDTAVNMFEGMDYETARSEAIKSYKEAQEYIKESE